MGAKALVAYGENELSAKAQVNISIIFMHIKIPHGSGGLIFNIPARRLGLRPGGGKPFRPRRTG